MDKDQEKDESFLPLRDVVFNRLRDEILHGKLKPGARLMEVELADRLGVSRTPVREAIRMLEHEGLAVMLPRRGAHVAGVTEKQLEDVLEALIGEKIIDEFDAHDDLRKVAERNPHKNNLPKNHQDV